MTMLLVLASTLGFLSGCGTGGYAGTGITSLSKSTATIDAGQTFSVTATNPTNLPVTWTLSGASCSGATCGAVSGGTNTGTVYTAPATVATQTVVTLTAAISGTQNIHTVAITVNPALAIPANLPSGTVGTAYSSTVSSTGGTAPVTLSLLSGTLPAGLTFDPASGKISGTPTAAGTSNFTIQAVDKSDVPSTVTAAEQIVVTTAGAVLTVVSGNPPAGVVGTAYSSALHATGGTQPYTWAVTSGALPAGLALSSTTGVISGNPTVAGNSTFSATATDASGTKASASFTIAVTSGSAPPLPLSITTGTLPNGTVSVPYSATIAVTGGTGPYTCTVVTGTLPQGLTMGAGCVVSGTPGVAGTSMLNIKATDSSNPSLMTTGNVSITISANNGTLTVTNGTLPNGTVGTAYSALIPVTGGTSPYTCTLTGGALPAGLSLNPNCTVSGNPTTAGTMSPTITIKDSSNPQQVITPQIGITIAPVPLVIGTGTLPPGTVGVIYTNPIPVTGGTGPYTCTLTSGSLPGGLSLTPSCTVTGTPTTPGTSTPVITIHDSGNPPQTITPTISITIAPAPLAVTNGTLPNGTVGIAYTQTIPITGGTGAYTCTLTSGAVPAGLTLNPNCTVTGNPTTQGTSTPTITIHDGASPPMTISPVISITINPSTFMVTNGTLPAGTVGVVYNQTIPIVGGTSPYTCTLASGGIPPGLAINLNCSVTGTPTQAGTYQPQLTIKDSTNPQQTITSTISITINPAALVLGTGGLPNGTVGTMYTATLPVTGGTPGYTCTLGSGTLPAGLALGAGCTVTGTPTTAGTSTPTINVSDSSTPALTTSGQVSITIVAAPEVLVIASPPPATINKPYTGTVPVTGGTGPYTCGVIPNAVPGLTVNADCSITGTPTTVGQTPVTVTVTDSSHPAVTKTGTTTITVNAATTTLTLTPPAAATVTVPYTGTVGVTGGTGPYTCTPIPNVVPGLTLNANCSVTGTPTVVAVTNVNVTATDSATTPNTNTAPVTFTVQAVTAVTLTGSLPNAIVGVAYTQTLQAAGGVGPYTYTLTGNLPAGLSLSTGGTISGTPTTPGASSFTVTATDSEATPKSASLPLVLLVVYPTTPDDSKLKGPYAYLFQGNDDIVLGVLTYRSATAASFTADGTGVISAGEMDSNHQTTTVSGNTIATNEFLGTYTIGTDLRGSLTLSTLATDGTVQSTTTYAIALRAPIAPITVSSTASIVQFDTNQLGGSKGSGTMLLQDKTKFAAGLTGSYVFGLQGDAPCFPTCTVGLVAGPAASVGQITASGGAITGTGDANLGATNYPSSQLTGNYGAADANGRVQLSMTTSELIGVPFPTDYAVYVVDSNHLFVLSTDKHSSYVLQSGTAQLQTQPTYDATSLGTAFVGYENSPVNPGLVGATLQSVASLASATIFRGVGNHDGTCTTTNVDTGGTTGLVNSIAGAVGGGAPLIGGLLGTYQSTGNSTCAVATNGRAVFNYPTPSSLLSTLLGLLGVHAVAPDPRIVYLVSPNSGYFLETSYAGIGTIEPQIGSPFTQASLDGKFIYSQVPASTIATIAGSGEFTADGAGHATTTLDENVGVGTLNVLQLGVTQANNYNLTDPSAGRYTLGNYGTIYAIAPGRFVLLQTDAIGTSPYIALLF